MDGHNMASIPIRLTHSEVAALAGLLDGMHDAYASGSLAISDATFGVLITARAKITKAATDIVHADTASRRRPTLAGEANGGCRYCGVVGLHECPTSAKPVTPEERAFLDYLNRARNRQINPDCETGEHPACGGDAWDLAAAALTTCKCECHT
jgi:hypothetical protein